MDKCTEDITSHLALQANFKQLPSAYKLESTPVFLESIPTFFSQTDTSSPDFYRNIYPSHCNRPPINPMAQAYASQQPQGFKNHVEKVAVVGVSRVVPIMI